MLNLILAVLLAADIYCSSCSKKIEGKFWKVAAQTGNYVYCDNCYNNLQRCAKCNIPVNSSFTADGKNFCNNCYSQLSRCSSCGAVITTSGWQYKNDNVNIYCTKCQHGEDHCDVCGAPTPEEFARIKLDDGRFICEKCNSTAIINSQEAVEILKNISDFLQVKFNMFVTHSAPIILANRDVLKSKAKSKIEGDTNRLFGLFLRKNDDYEIYLLNGLPRSVAIAVLAHEYTHSWQEEHCVRGQPLLIREGFAEWIAYKTLMFYNLTDEAKMMEERQQDVYGEGLKKMLKLETVSNELSVFRYGKYAK